MPKFIHKQFKTILNKQKYIDNWFWTRYSINPYNGCQFGCIYCDGRSERYRMQDAFSETIVIKENVGEMLDQRISRARALLPDVVGFGGVTDGYQPIEQKAMNTRTILEVLHKHRFPVHMLTKSKLVLNDLELFEAIGQQSWATVSVTLTTLNPDIAKIIEPRASTPEERLDIIRQFKKLAPHVQTGFLLMPMIPGLTDKRDDIKIYLRTIQDAGADYCLFSGLTMRDRQADYFLKRIHDHYPEALKQMEPLYHFQYEPDFYQGQYTASEGYQKMLNEMMLELCGQVEMPFYVKRFIPNDFRRTNYTLAETILNTSFKRQLQGGNWYDLFWTGQHIQNMKEPIEDVAARNELETIPNVKGKLLEYIKKEVKPSPSQITLFDRET